MKPITIYTTQNCHFCQLAKEFFKANNLSYTEHNVGVDFDKRKEMMELTGQMGVPVIQIGEDVVVGFSEAHMRQMLGMAA